MSSDSCHLSICLTRGLQAPEQQTRLRCYLSSHHPLLVLSPARVEELNLEPRILIFHNVLSEKETDGFIRLARPLILRINFISIYLLQNNQLSKKINEIFRSVFEVGKVRVVTVSVQLSRSMVQSREQLEDQVSTVRTSQNAWLTPEMSPLMLSRVAQRVSALTGLSIDPKSDHSELPQVANYGIGGHYVPHFDYLILDKTPAEVDTTTSNCPSGSTNITIVVIPLFYFIISYDRITYNLCIVFCIFTVPHCRNLKV
ncbi:hypothetical protein LAZ67_4004223 [Cordylochernes scorpioides]|uniref:Prolyl 4-hydroxylase alpha subunit domain-containing protein n=1 Tax=Cordylochernes scorpioides TaxID=51811 RepID=A0ABY6KHA7_9ARAC|nr:hypothetical protein LAZ67_4004223 [Cordylochernes scorpioides]